MHDRIGYYKTPTGKPVIRKQNGVWAIFIKSGQFCGGLEYIAALNWVNKLNKELK
jgi:hypothetical protein